MKKIVLILISALIWFVACDDPIISKPEHLIKRDQMIDMLVDIHKAEAMYNKFRNDTSRTYLSSSDFYFSVLAKYDVSDSVFEKSFMYYASEPKNFEKMYRKVMSQLSEKEQELSGKKNQELDFGDDPKTSRPH